MNERSVNNQNKNRISSLDGLKAILLISLFCWHTPTNPNWPIGEPIIDIGARMCEVLFIVSGFLVAYNHYNKPILPTLKESIKYVFNKIKKIWPIHVIAFIIIVVYLVTTNQLNFNTSTILSAIINLCLLQSWTSDPYTFNSVAWFLSSLMFCYFMSPFLMTVFRKSTRFITCTFISCTIIRILLELACINGLSIISFDFHTSPIIRCLEFFMGMMMFSLYLRLKNSINNNTTLMMTIIEIIVTALYIFLAIKMEGKWIRGYFVLLACILVFVYALNGGLLSKLLSTKI